MVLGGDGRRHGQRGRAAADGRRQDAEAEAGLMFGMVAWRRAEREVEAPSSASVEGGELQPTGRMAGLQAAEERGGSGR